jgi:hypothetical protein
MPSGVHYSQIDLFPSELAVRKLGASSHIGFKGVFYSVPYCLYGQKLIVRADGDTVDILNSRGQCVASHKRSFVKRKYITDPSHMPGLPDPHLHDARYYSGDKFRELADEIGENTYDVIDLLLDSKPYEEYAYKSCMAIIQLSKKFGHRLLEEACKEVLSTGSCNYYAIHKFLKQRENDCK